VYSLGVILFQLLTNELPFRGTVQMLLYKVINDEPPSLRRLDNSIPQDLETICLKCLEKEPRLRFSTAEELTQELERFLNGQPIESRPIGRVGRIWRWYRRNPDALRLTAGGYCVASGSLLSTWAVMGLIYVIVGVSGVEPDRQARFVMELIGLLCCVWTPLLILGLYSLNGRYVSLLVALALWLFLTIATAVSIAGVQLSFATFETNRLISATVSTRLQFFTLLFIFAFLGFVSHVLAILSVFMRPERASDAQS
jgi:hypothetical protein